MTAVAASYTFDRLTYVDRLRNDAGLDERTARAHADALDHALRDAVATKADLARVETALKTEIAEVKAEIQAIDARIDVLKANVKAEFAAVRGEIAGVQGELKADIADVRGEISTLKWVIFSMIPALLALLVKVFLF